MGQQTILVCDDEPHILHVVSTKLRNAGYEVITAADGEEGLNLAVQHTPALIITDYQMPMLSGLELCAKLRAEPGTCNIPVVMLTARGFSMNDQDLKETNVRKVLPKPFSPREILRTTQEILGGAVAETLGGRHRD
ncbi:MAG TPA: response regulator [Phycisphaerae bacterium]|nr:response regulator [Phycisphaerae bacterium]